jgi:hypothetical protein
MAPMSMGLVSAEALARLRDQGFDAEAYGARYPDVAMVGMDPAEHFLWIGQRLGRRWGEPKAVTVGREDPLHRQVAAALAGVVVGDCLRCGVRRGAVRCGARHGPRGRRGGRCHFGG